MAISSPNAGNSTVNVRSVLQYVPDFRGKLFFVHLSESLLESRELVDALLDLDALQEIGVRLVIVAEGGNARRLHEFIVECEMRSCLLSDNYVDGKDSLEQIVRILDRGQAPVIASGRLGTPFPLEIVEAAASLKASKYICLLESGRVPARDGQPIHAILELDVESCGTDITNLDLLVSAAKVCRKGIPRVHLLDGFRRGVLVEELFSEEGVGTMVHADTYREIRPLQEEDIPELLSMIGRSIQSTDLIERSYEDVSQRLNEYFVLTLDETIVGSVAVHIYPEHNTAELACLYIKHRHEGLGYGRELVNFAEKVAEESGMDSIFAISKSAVEFFRDRLHYAEWPRELLPPERLADLEKSGRNSGVSGHSFPRN